MCHKGYFFICVTFTLLQMSEFSIVDYGRNLKLKNKMDIFAILEKKSLAKLKLQLLDENVTEYPETTVEDKTEEVLPMLGSNYVFGMVEDGEGLKPLLDLTTKIKPADANDVSTFMKENSFTESIIPKTTNNVFRIIKRGTTNKRLDVVFEIIKKGTTKRLSKFFETYNKATTTSTMITPTPESLIAEENKYEGPSASEESKVEKTEPKNNRFRIVKEEVTSKYDLPLPIEEGSKKIDAYIHSTEDNSSSKPKVTSKLLNQKDLNMEAFKDCLNRTIAEAIYGANAKHLQPVFNCIGEQLNKVGGVVSNSQVFQIIPNFTTKMSNLAANISKSFARFLGFHSFSKESL